MTGNRPLTFLIAILALSACHGGRAADEPPVAKRQGTIGLFSSLPIYWGEQDDVSSLIDGQQKPGWVRQAIERRASIAPLDALERDNLAGIRQLVLAQPRPLAPSENVALDEWVRKGGHLLVFADPMLTQHSHYHLGDKRRPQDMVLLSPILARWGLDLHFDENQPSGERLEPVAEKAIPVNLAGRFTPRAGGHEAKCTLSGNGLLARCAIGKGTATLFADAALLEDGEDGAVDPARRSALLDVLLAESLGS